MNIYLSGPMSHQPYFNYMAFQAEAARLRAEGHTVFNPIESDIANYGYDLFTDPNGDPAVAKSKHGFDLRTTLGDDLDWLCKYAEAIVLLPGWRNSKGANAEHAVSVALGLKVIEVDPWGM